MNDWVEWLLDIVWGLLVAFGMLAFVAFLAFLSVGCASAPPAPPPGLPPPMDIAALLPPAPPPPAIPLDIARYDDLRVRAKQCPGLPAGILVSPAVYAEQLAVLSDRKRLRLELAATTRLRTEERRAAEALEQAYQARFAKLADAERWFRWKLLGAALFGGVFTLATVAASVRATK